MNAAFVKTEPTAAADGAAYCPIERKRRGPAALAASIAVMLAGAGFLTFSVMSAPTTAPSAPALNAPVETTPIETSAPQEAAARDTADLVADALAQSQSARASLSPSAEPSARPSGLAPRLKPSARANVPVEDAGAGQAPQDNKDFALAPRLKPAPPNVKPVVVAGARPMRLGGAMLASADDRPPPVFFQSDIERRDQARAPAALALSRDVTRERSDLHIRIARGETFVDALERAGVSADERNAAAYAFGKEYNLRKLLPGQEFVLSLGWPNQTLYQTASAEKEPQARLLALEFRPDAEKRIFMRKQADGGYSAHSSIVELTTRIMSIEGRINGSLYMSAKAVGAPDMIIAELADAFSYDVDFQREIFGGDEFEAIFEVRYDDQGNLVSTGDILFARLNWRGRQKEKGYYRFDSNEDGRGEFYDAAGKSAKRLLMKTPIDGARLSSGFGTRKHPILGYRRAHKGVDFAAPRGTPIKAAGDGVVERADRYGSFGNYIRLRHANGYQTAYAHLNGFARGVRKGRRVRQGDIIGYVGTTGRSTGPHLHYEVHLHGTAVNPQRLKISTTGKTLAGAELDQFQAHRDLIDAMRAATKPAPESDRLLAAGEARSAL